MFGSIFFPIDGWLQLTGKFHPRAPGQEFECSSEHICQGEEEECPNRRMDEWIIKSIRKDNDRKKKVGRRVGFLTERKHFLLSG